MDKKLHILKRRHTLIGLSEWGMKDIADMQRSSEGSGMPPTF